MHYIYNIKLIVTNLRAHKFYNVVFNFVYKINILQATKTENKIVTSVSPQINIIFNLHTYLLFRHLFICMMMVHEKDQTCSVIDTSNKVLLCSITTHSVTPKTLLVLSVHLTR
jgi:hypothetical protein